MIYFVRTAYLFLKAVSTLCVRFLLFMLCWSMTTSLGLLKLSVLPSALSLTTFMQSSTMQFSTHAPQYMQRSSVMATSPAFQKSAFVGHALMHSLHSTPLHILLFMVTFPLAKNCFMLRGARSSSLRFCLSFSVVSTKSWKMFALGFALSFCINFIF